MKDPQLEKMTLAELRELSERIGAMLDERKSREKSELRDRMNALAKELGYNLTDVLGGSRKGGKGRAGTAGVKYRHPSDESKTWSGRGRRPKWLENVSNIEKYRVG